MTSQDILAEAIILCFLLGDRMKYNGPAVDIFVLVVPPLKFSTLETYQYVVKAAGI